MSADPRFNRESFQSLLANAFSVQQSGMSPESLAAIIEMQRVVTSDAITADDAMTLVAERAQAVAKASGVGVALLDGNQLVHRAGSGIAVQNIGSHVTAVLSNAASDHPRREILRVEDAGTDSRIEAEICRQFEAQALLLVPIYHEQAMIGVLEVLFDQAHKFTEPETRAYQLMATLAGDASKLSPLRSERGSVSTTVSRAVLRMNSQIRQLVVKQAPQAPARPANVPSRYDEAVATLRQWDVRAKLSTFGAAVRAHLHRVRLRQARVAQWHWPQISFPSLRVPWGKLAFAKFRRTNPAFRIKWPRESQLHWNVAAVALILALAMIAAIARHSSTTPPVSASSPTSEPAAALPALSPAEQPIVQAASSKAVVVGHVHDADAPSSSFKRVWVRKDEVDYIANDVTIRHFRPQPAPTKTRAWKKQVNIGEDVTVRYFNSPPAPATTSSTEATERSVKD